MSKAHRLKSTCKLFESARGAFKSSHNPSSFHISRVVSSVAFQLTTCPNASHAQGCRTCPSDFAHGQGHIGRRSIFNVADESKKYSERKLIGYSPQQLYTVVAGIEHYKDFVPWCVRSDITHQPSADYLEAELEVGFRLFTERYTSKVTLHKPDKVFSSVADSTLFDHLDSTWEFHKGPTPTTTWLTFGVDFAFKSPLYKHVASVFFDEVVKRMMNAFESRCRALYGPSQMQRPLPRRPVAA